MNENQDPYNDWDGAYVLGALSMDERREFENHLISCGSCAAAVAELAGIPGILTKIGSTTAAALLTSDEDLPTYDPDREFLSLQFAAARVKARARRFRTIQFAAAVAASVVLVLGGMVVGNGSYSLGSLIHPKSQAAAQSIPVAMVGVSATVIAVDLSLTKEVWGTKFAWNCRYNQALESPSEPKSYDLVVIDAEGGETTVATWKSTDSDVEGLLAATKIPTSELRRVDVRATGSRTPLLSGTV